MIKVIIDDKNDYLTLIRITLMGILLANLKPLLCKIPRNSPRKFPTASTLRSNGILSDHLGLAGTLSHASLHDSTSLRLISTYDLFTYPSNKGYIHREDSVQFVASTTIGRLNRLSLSLRLSSNPKKNNCKPSNHIRMPFDPRLI